MVFFDPQRWLSVDQRVLVWCQVNTFLQPNKVFMGIIGGSCNCGVLGIKTIWHLGCCHEQGQLISDWTQRKKHHLPNISTDNPKRMHTLRVTVYQNWHKGLGSTTSELLILAIRLKDVDCAAEFHYFKYWCDQAFKSARMKTMRCGWKFWKSL